MTRHKIVVNFDQPEFLIPDVIHNAGCSKVHLYYLKGEVMPMNGDI